MTGVDDAPAVGERGPWVVAVVLAIGLVLAVNSITVAVLWDAVHSSTSGLSENATQILTGAFGGIIGGLGSVRGYRAGVERAARPPAVEAVEAVEA